MKPFENVAGSEKAIRRGRIVPDGDVNLAFVKTPELSPKENVVVVDTSRIVEENVASGDRGCKLYYANGLGVLVDDNDNMVVSDEYPVVTDEFSIDEDFSQVPGSEYRDEHILGYQHTSRHFHLDHAGLTLGGDTVSYEDDAIKVVDGRGIEHSHYRIKITPAYLPQGDSEVMEGSVWAYRVFAFVDTAENEDLYLTYNKVELTDEGALVRRQINYREILNPEPFFQYTPEESEVADPANRHRKIFSTKPISYKNQIIGNNSSQSTDGYKVFVPKKAIGDPRLYQLFRWRINCTFVQDAKVDPSRDMSTIKCGVVVTDLDLATGTPSRAPYAFLNLARSRYNAKSLIFENPLQDTHSASEQERREYWFVNIDHDDLSEYDILIWAPQALNFNYSKYAAKVDNFVNTHGGTIFIDTNNWTDATTTLGGRVSATFNPKTGKIRSAASSGASITPARIDGPRWGAPEHVLMNANQKLGGWAFITDLEHKIFVQDPVINKSMKIDDYDGSTAITRGPFAHVLLEFAKTFKDFPIPARRSGAFSDVNSSTPNRDAIERLANFNPAIIAVGYDGGAFGPNNKVTRAQAAAFLDRLYTNVANHFPWANQITGGSVSQYSDVGSNFVHAGALGRMSVSGIMIGYPDGTFRPQEQLSHQQCANIFQRFIDHLRTQLPAPEPNIPADFTTISSVATNDDIYYLSNQQHYRPAYCQHFSTLPPGYDTLVEAPLDVHPYDTYRSVTVVKKVNSGHKILSTMGHLFTCSSINSYINGSVLSSNTGTTLARVDDNYVRHISGIYVEGAMKLLYNAALLAVRGRIVDDSDETKFSTTWIYSTPWRSSWVINTTDDLDVLSDREKKEHNFKIEPRDIHAAEPDDTRIWKRKLSDKTIEQLMNETLEPIMNNPAARIRVEGSTRSYSVEITNPAVHTDSRTVEKGFLYAYTDAYTPKFTVPVELGPHVFKEEFDEQGRRGRVAEYDDVTYVHREYPEKPYKTQVTAVFAATEEFTTNQEANYTVTGTAVGTTTVTTSTPPSTTTRTSDVTLNWWDERKENSAPPYGNQHRVGSMFALDNTAPNNGMVKPVGIANWADVNYYTSAWGPGHLAWPYYGMTSRIDIGSSGDLVRFVQHALNRFSKAGYYKGRLVEINGRYQTGMKDVIRSFQSQMRARYVDGVIDAETWFLIAVCINRLKKDGKMPSVGNTDYRKYYAWFDRIQLHRVSDGNNSSYFAKRSWRTGGPSLVWDLFSVGFSKEYRFHGLTVVPWAGGNANSIMVRSIHVVRSPFSFTNYNSDRGQLTYMKHRPKDGQALYIPFGPYTGDTIVLGVGQDKSSGFGTSRMFGIRDIRAHARVTTTTHIASTTTITSQQRDVNFTLTGKVDVERNKTLQLKPPKIAGYNSISNIRFTNISVSNPEVVASITQSGLVTFENNVIASNNGSEVKKGPEFPSSGFTYFSMDENGVRSPVPETGWISKADGIKVLCDARRRPVGFPDLPTSIGPNEAQRHYVKLSLSTVGTDSSIQIGFYDFNHKEFVTSIDGRPEISYIEYLTRGPQNIFIAMVSDYEKSQEQIIPSDDDAPLLPYRWAMPVYGVCTRTGSKITLDSLPDRLGPTDVWPIAVRDGMFTRSARIRERYEGPISGWVGDYQGETVEALYALPEAELGGYSTVHGPPNADVVDEEPIILDDDVIQVRQAPILTVKTPTLYPNPADPVRPVFKLYKRVTHNSPWVPQPMTAIRDYNTSTGEIFLADRLTSNDTSLLRVDYTTSRRSYHFKKHGDQILNLNSYSGHTRDLMGEAIYVYILPMYVKDAVGNVITASVQERALRMSTSPGVFDPLRPEYNPLAIQLGVIYLSAALDIDRLAVLDTRRRGGGLKDGVNVQEVTRLVNEAWTYWDVKHAAGSSYQKGGFVVVRLPEQLRDEFSERELVDIIERNITAGVGFKVETLQGEDWS